MKAIYETKNYTICTATVKEVAELDNLPTVQQVRGSVWPAEQAETFVKDVAAGKFFPAIVYTIDKDGEKACVDGQQRSKTLRDALKAGKLTGDETVIVAISNNTIEDDFKRLNVGVPVAKALVTTAELGTSGESVLTVASHPYFTGVKFSGLQVQRCARADMALGILCICSGWNYPNSNTKDAAAWIKAHSADVTEDSVKDTLGCLDAISDAVKRYTDFIEKNGKSKACTATARRLVAGLRKKNLFYTAIDAINAGYDAKDVLAALANQDMLDSAKVPLETVTNGRKKTENISWPVGGGSSGSSIDFTKRQTILEHVIGKLTPEARECGLTVPKKDEEKKAKADAAAAVAELLG